jgi:hypothetical protein
MICQLPPKKEGINCIKRGQMMNKWRRSLKYEKSEIKINIIENFQNEKFLYINLPGNQMPNI